MNLFGDVQEKGENNFLWTLINITDMQRLNTPWN